MQAIDSANCQSRGRGFNSRRARQFQHVDTERGAGRAFVFRPTCPRPAACVRTLARGVVSSSPRPSCTCTSSATRPCRRLLFRHRTIVEAMVALEAPIDSFAAKHQNETLEDILARDTGDRLTLTFRAHVLHCHCARPDIESGGLKCRSGALSGNGTMNGRTPLRERALPGHRANQGALADSLAEEHH